MARQYVSYADGRSGNQSAATGTINTYATMTANAGEKKVTTSLSVSVGDMVLLITMKNGNYGANEVVSVSSVGSGFFNATTPLENTYSGVSQAIRIPQYIADGPCNNTITGLAWNGSIGGVIILASTGTFNGTATFNGFGNNGDANKVAGVGLGFAGGPGGGPNGSGQGGLSFTGEGVLGQGFQQESVGNGGGGGRSVNQPSSFSGGGGGSNGTAGTQGYDKFGQGGGYPATLVNPATSLLSIWMGGGGGGGQIDGGGDNAGGGAGGGIVIIIAPTIDISSMTINCNGGNGGGTAATYGAGGGGAGGSILLIGNIIILGSNRATAIGGNGGNSNSGTFQGDGGPGGNGLIAARYRDTISGNTNPSIVAVKDTELFKPRSSLAYIID